MKKFVCAFMLCVMLFSVPAVSYASSSLERIGENILSNILTHVLTDALKKNGMGDLLGGENAGETPGTVTDEETKTSTELGDGTELTAEQYQSFSEICLAGSLEEFRKKMEYEKISPKAKFTKEDGTVITLLEMAKSSPNPELAEFLYNNGVSQNTASEDVKGE